MNDKRRSIIKSVKVVLFILLLYSFRCILIVFKSASFLKWYDLLPASVLLAVLIISAVLSYYDETCKENARKNWLIIEVNFDNWSGEVERFFKKTGITQKCDQESFIRQATIEKISREE